MSPTKPSRPSRRATPVPIKSVKRPPSTTVRLSTEAKSTLRKLAILYGISMTSALELLLRGAITVKGEE